MRPRLALFLAALAPRLILAWITFGAVDAVHNFRNFVRMLSGAPIITPYLPGIELVIWLGSVTAYFTQVPLTAAYKLLPVVVDALIAVSLYDAARDAREGVRNALLYAAAFVPAAVSALHPQWDSLVLWPLLIALLLLRKGHPGADALAGAAIVVSIIWKPIAPPLIPFLIPWDRRRAAAFVGGAAAAAAAYLALLFATGHMFRLGTLAGIASYAGGGVQLFGLAYRPHNRLLIVAGAFALVAWLRFRRRCTGEESVLLFFAVVLGLSGLSVQYLCWIVPFAIVCGHRRFLALYGGVAGLFVLYFYQVPIANLNNADNLGTLALLRPLGRFAPPLPPAWVDDAVRLFGNVLIPLLLLTFAGWRVIAMLKRGRFDDELPTVVRTRTLLVAPAIVALIVGVWSLWAAMQPRIEPKAFIARVEQRIGEYDVVRYRGPLAGTPGAKVWISRSATDPRVPFPVFHLGTVLLIWVLGSSVITAAVERK